MYNVKRLAGIAQQGLTDLWPALRQAFNRDPSDDRLHRVYGPWPRATVIALAIGAVAVGEAFARLGPDLPFDQYVHWPAIAVGAVFATLVRRYLFTGDAAREEDYPWLAASLAPAFALVMVLSPLLELLLAVESAPASESDGSGSVLGTVLVAVTDEIGIAAAMTIAVAALCYSRNWVKALFDLGVRLLVFKIMVWVTALVMLEIGIVGQIVGAMVHALTGWRLPEWLKELSDQISYAGLLTIAYLAVIGATWTVCRRSFAELLASGQVNILDAVVAMAEDPAKRERRIKRKNKRQERRSKARKTP